MVLPNAAEALRALHFAGFHRRAAFDAINSQPSVRALVVVQGKGDPSGLAEQGARPER